MKLQRYKYLFAVFFFAASLFAVLALPTQVQAAGCNVSASPAKLQECKDKYIAKCKEMGFAPTFCKNISVDQYNDCAEGSGIKLNETCMGNIKVSAGNPTISKAAQTTCKNTYSGHGSGNGTDNKMTSALYQKYKNSKCDFRKGGNCSVNGSSQGAITTCSDPAAPATSTPSASSSSSGSKCDSLDPTCTKTDGDCREGTGDNIANVDKDNCAIIGYIVVITNVLSALVGIVVVAMIITGGIQYSTAGSDSSKIQAAKQKITNAILALIIFIFSFAIIQWLIPGGLI